MELAQLSTAEFLAHLRQLKIRLSLDEEGANLRLKAPSGVLSGDLKSQIASRKPAILDFLRPDGNKLSSQEQPIVPIDRQGSLPISFSQQRLWFLDQFEPGSPVYNISSGMRLSGVLDVAALESALSSVIRRHETLRTSIVTENGEPAAIVHEVDAWTLPVTDLQGLSQAERDSTVRKIAAEESMRSFSLSKGPLIRNRLLVIGPQEHVLIVVVHHIVADGWSLGILVKEIAEFYSASVTGKDVNLTELEVQYTDYAHWQRRWLEGPVLEAQEDYWKTNLKEPLPVLEMPLDRPRPALQTFNGDMVTTALPKPLIDQLQQLARQEKSTLFIVLLAALAALLARYSGQEDVIVGSSSSGRGRTEIEELIGFFINNLVMRTDLSGNPSFRELVSRVREVALGAYANQDVPFERLVEIVPTQRSLSHSPIFQVMFNFQSYPNTDLRLPGLFLSPLKMPIAATRYDLNLDAHEINDGLALFLNYNTDLFDKETVERLLSHFANFLEAAVEDPEVRLSDVRLLSEDEERVLLHDRNDTVENFADGVLVTLLEAQAVTNPQAVAAEFEAARLSYEQLNCRANQVACRLQELGVGPGILVGICVRRSLDMLIGLLGILKSGGAYVPLDPGYPADRLAFMIEDSGLSVLVTEQECCDLLPDGAQHRVVLDSHARELAGLPTRNLDIDIQPSDLAYVIYTSGSTGKPKGVQIPHRALINFLHSMAREPGLGADDRLLAVTTISFDISGLELYLPLLRGARVVLASRDDCVDGSRLRSLIKQSGATVMQATPATWRLLLESGWSDGAGIKLLCGGEALPRDLADKLLATGAEVWNLYGPTETTIWSTIWRVVADGIIAIGRPIANTEIYILDQNYNLVPPGVAGELFIGGQGLANGYLNRPELTAERFLTNPFSEDPEARMYRTGDLARYRGDGTIECLGRIDHQVKLHGFRIELGEIEAALASHEQLEQTAVVVREDRPGDRRLVAYLVATGENAPDHGELRRHLQEMLPAYMVPSAFVFLAELPLTPNGKVDRKSLPAPDSERPELESAYVAPKGDLEQSIIGAWQDVLQLEKIGVQDNFFDLGGNSLLIVRLQAKLTEILAQNIPIVELFQKPTVQSLAQYLEGGRSEDDAADRIQARIAKQRQALSGSENK